MKSFKFFSDNDEDDLVPINSEATWMWSEEFGLTEINGFRWVLTRATSYGILRFLSNFPDYFIVPIESITHGDIRHDNTNQDEGWGFDITSDYLTIEFYNLIPIE